MNPKKIIAILAVALALAVAALGIIIAARITAGDNRAETTQIIASNLSSYVEWYKDITASTKPINARNRPVTAKSAKEYDDRNYLETLKLKRAERKLTREEQYQKQEQELESEATEMVYAGTFSVCGYDTCAACCGWSTGITASGTTATIGRTCASNDFPFGTILYIDGIGERVVEDRGGMPRGVLDVLCKDHPSCYAITGTYDVYIIQED